MKSTIAPVVMMFSILLTGCPQNLTELDNTLDNALSPQSAQATATGFDPTKSAEPTAAANEWNRVGDRDLTEQDLVAIVNLAWPQEYQSISDRFGTPAKRDESGDYYKIANRGNGWVVIWYTGTKATGYSVQ